MTVSFGFYDSIASDRLYNAQQMGRIFDGIILDGVYAGLGDKLMVVEDVLMDVTVGSGRAWLDHTWTLNDANLTKAIATADALLNRIDVVYLEVNEGVGTRANSIAVLTGTPATTPVAPTLTDTAEIHQYPLAHIYVGAAVTEITQANITNKVGTVDTPFVAGIIDYVTTNEILAQWEDEWEEWFDAIKDQLSTEAETNLQAQIWAIVGDINPPLLDIIALEAHNHDGTDTVQLDAGGIAANAVETTKINALAVTSSKLGPNAVIAGKIADGAVDDADILVSNLIDDSKVGNRVPALTKRKGGNANNWATAGTTTYIPTAVRMQSGVVSVTIEDGQNNGVAPAITFPTAFAYVPQIFFGLEGDPGVCSPRAEDLTSSGFTLKAFRTSTSMQVTYDVHWLAVGPE